MQRWVDIITLLISTKKLLSFNFSCLANPIVKICYITFRINPHLKIYEALTKSPRKKLWQLISEGTIRIIFYLWRFRLRHYFMSLIFLLELRDFLKFLQYLKALSKSSPQLHTKFFSHNLSRKFFPISVKVVPAHEKATEVFYHHQLLLFSKLL